MNIREINELLEKYEEGLTSLEEEARLKEFFSSAKVPPELEPWKAMFGFFSEAAGETMPGEAVTAPAAGKVINLQRRSAVPLAAAATLLLLIAIGWFLRPDLTKNPGTFSNPEQAYAETKQVLLAISDQLNTPQPALQKLGVINAGISQLANLEQLDKGLAQFEKLSQLDRNVNKIKSK